ncbi:MAG: universal stress protein [Bacteroidota bacterium]
MNRILIPVDFSDTSLNALDYATKLFGGSALEVTILHTYEVSSSAFRMKSMDRIMEVDAQHEMDALLKRMREDRPDISVQSKIMKSDAVSAITFLGNSGTYDFIVMGTKGASGLKEVFIGSVAGGVISKTKAPVLVVPGGSEYRPLQEITFAFSGNTLSNDNIVEPLRKLVMLHTGKVNVLHISEGEKPDVENALGPIADLDPTVTYVFGAGDVNEQLNKYLKKETPELLCLVRGKKGFFSRIFGESVTMKQTFNSPVPLLILHG